MNKNDVNTAKPRVHKCSVCKKNFFWSDKACWFGIEEDKKGNRKILEKCCSHECFNRSKYRKEDPEFMNE